MISRLQWLRHSTIQNSSQSKVKEIEFQVVIPCMGKIELAKELILPKVFEHVFCEEKEFNIELVNLMNASYSASVERLGNGFFKICGNEWDNFVSSYPFSEVAEVCFKLKEGSTFEVHFFDEKDREFRWFVSPGQSTVRSQLIEKLSELLIYQLNANNEHTWQTTATIVGRKQNGSADVEYHSFSTYEGICQFAIGFEGSNWKNFCVENDIRIGNILKFVALDDLSFRVDVLNSEGVIVGLFENELGVADHM